MQKRARKVMVLCLDGPIVPRLQKYCQGGELPALASVINSGVWAKNAMVPLPTATPATWPPVVNNGIQIGGAGVDVNQWFYPALMFGSHIKGTLPDDSSDAVSRFAQRGIGTGDVMPRMWATLSHARLFSTKAFRTGVGAPTLIEQR